MTRKQRRMVIALTSLAGLGAATALVLTAFSDNMVFFMTPADIAEKNPSSGQTIRLGGLVEAGSVQHATVDGMPTAMFKVTDGKSEIRVTYTGILPDLFREGQGVVAVGALGPDHDFVAQEVLAKHDEKYMPKDVADALKKRGYWKDQAPAGAPGS